MCTYAFRIRNCEDILEILEHQERLNDIKKGPNDNFRDCKILSKVEPMYLEVKLKESMFE